MDEERRAFLKQLEDSLGYPFTEVKWLDRALTHKSFIYETNHPEKGDNEVLEFLGDAVLNLAVSALLFQRFPDAQEGTLSMMRSQLVRRSFLASLSKQLQLERYLLLGKSQQSHGGVGKSTILGNTYEALIGAIFMDSGFNRALETIRVHFEPYLQTKMPSGLFEDYKSLLQIHSQQSYGFSPQYQVTNESGPDHDKRFQASVTIGGEVKGLGWGKSKKEAEQEAAKNALEEINKMSNDKVQSSNEKEK